MAQLYKLEIENKYSMHVQIQPLDLSFTLVYAS
jgi:hypothetical protein